MTKACVHVPGRHLAQGTVIFSIVFFILLTHATRGPTKGLPPGIKPQPNTFFNLDKYTFYKTCLACAFFLRHGDIAQMADEFIDYRARDGLRYVTLWSDGNRKPMLYIGIHYQPSVIASSLTEAQVRFASHSRIRQVMFFFSNSNVR